MATCNRCGEYIEFRSIDGMNRPIHPNGGFHCSGGESPRYTSGDAFRETKSYLDPNAICPVCQQKVFFYRSPHGGRVFFDDVGWPWPKHGCTDKLQSSDFSFRKPVNSSLKFQLKNREGNLLRVARMEGLVEMENEIRFTLVPGKIGVSISRFDLKQSGITIEDLKAAPSFVFPASMPPEGALSFICERRRCIVSVRASIRSTDAGKK